MKRGLLLDVDGVLLDSARQQYENWRWWGETRKLSEGQLERLLGIHGVRARDKIQTFLPDITDAKLAAEVALMEQVERENASEAKALPGAIEALKLGREGRPLVLVTGGTYSLIVARLSAAGLPSPNPGGMVTAESTEFGKPDAAPYREGARRLGLPPEDCDAVEDSWQGIQSARAAGVGRVIGVTTTLDAHALRHADTVVPDLLAALSFLYPAA